MYLRWLTMVGSLGFVIIQPTLKEGFIMGKPQVIARRDGVSSTGSPHGLLVETLTPGSIRFTVTGHDGKKRHAAVTLSSAEVCSLIETLSAHIDAEGQS